MPRLRHIEGLEATRLAQELAKREPVRMLPSDGTELVKSSGPPADQSARRAPPRLKKASKHSNVVLSLEHKAALRSVFGDTLSDEFVEVMLTQLVSALSPGPWDVLEEATLNAAIALIASIKPQSELEALIAVRHVHIHSGGQGVVGIVNSGKESDQGERGEK
jgi:hypothetical protein